MTETPFWCVFNELIILSFWRRVDWAFLLLLLCLHCVESLISMRGKRFIYIQISSQIFTICLLYICLSVRLSLCQRQDRPKICRLFCLVKIKSLPMLTACVFWLTVLCSNGTGTCGWEQTLYAKIGSALFPTSVALSTLAPRGSTWIPTFRTSTSKSIPSSLMLELY